MFVVRVVEMLRFEEEETGIVGPFDSAEAADKWVEEKTKGTQNLNFRYEIGNLVEPY